MKKLKLETIKKHDYSNYLIKIIHDKKIVISVNDNIRFWHMTVFSEIITLKGNGRVIESFAVTSDNRHLIAGAGNELIIWDITDLTAIKRNVLPGHISSITSVAITPDDTHAISASDDSTIRIWNIKKNEELKILHGHKEMINKMILTPDGKKIISGSSDCTLKIWDLKTGENLKTLNGHDSDLECILALKDNRHIISGDNDGSIKIWDIISGENLMNLKGHSDWVTRLALTPNGELISGSIDGSLKIWNLKNGMEIKTLAGHKDMIKGISVIPNTNHMISVSDDKTIRMWNIGTGKTESIFHTDKTLSSCDVSSDGKNLVAGNDFNLNSGNIYFFTIN